MYLAVWTDSSHLLKANMLSSSTQTKKTSGSCWQSHMWQAFSCSSQGGQTEIACSFNWTGSKPTVQMPEVCFNSTQEQWTSGRWLKAAAQTSKLPFYFWALVLLFGRVLKKNAVGEPSHAFCMLCWWGLLAPSLFPLCPIMMVLYHM